jgi:uncharacterized alpha-E superfamily protein
MISRVADHCFWLGRYLERVESTARLLQVTAGLALDAELTPAQCWAPIVITAGEQWRFPVLCGEAAMGDGEAVQRYLTFDARVPVSLVRSVGAARENARSIREVISLEAWETLNALHLYVQGPRAKADYDQERHKFFTKVRREVQLCAGLLRASMLHDHPLHYVWLGVHLERVGQTARILDVHHHAFLDTAPTSADIQVAQVSLWLSLLKACYGFEAFMKSNRGKVTPGAVASFLIFEPRFPRSVLHGLREAHEIVAELCPPTLEVDELQTSVQLGLLEAWLEERHRKNGLDAQAVHQLLTRVVDETQALCELVQSELINTTKPTPSAPVPAPAEAAAEAPAVTRAQAPTAGSASQRQTG